MAVVYFFFFFFFILFTSSSCHIVAKKFKGLAGKSILTPEDLGGAWRKKRLVMMGFSVILPCGRGTGASVKHVPAACEMAHGLLLEYVCFCHAGTVVEVVFGCRLCSVCG